MAAAKKPPSAVSIFGAPPSKGAKGSAYQQFINYWASKGYKNLRGATASAIYKAAIAEKIDPVTFAAVILNESGGNFNTPDSSMGAVGIGQLEPKTFLGPNGASGGVLPWDNSQQITAKMLRNGGVNLRLAAWYVGQLQGSHPSNWYGAYNAGANQSPALLNQIQSQFWSKWVSKWNPSYVSTSGGTGPPSPAGPQTPGGTAQQPPDVKDPYVVLGKNGQVGYVNSQGQVPKNSLNWFGLPMTRSQFLQYQNQLDNTYLAYTGKRATPAQVANTIKNGWSTTQVQMQLAQTPAFKNSPVWKQNAPSYTAAWQSIYGPNSKPDPKALRYAIVHNLDTTAFQNTLRQRSDYTNSQEFKQKSAALSGSYTKIYGVPDQNGLAVIKAAAKNGYDQNQFENYLRKQPQYTSSDEFKANAMGWAQSMGLLNSGAWEANAGLATATTPGPAAPVPGNVNGAPPPVAMGQSGYAQDSTANLH